MRASHIFIVAAVLAAPSTGHSQDSGLVSGRVGSDLSASTTQPGPTFRAPYGTRPEQAGPRAGYSGVVMPGQVVPGNVPVWLGSGGQGTAFVDGHRVLVNPSSNRILRVFN
jgi:hypothetical protein